MTRTACITGPGSRATGAAISLNRTGFGVRDVDNKDELVLRQGKADGL
jgi:hypothetical protein